MNYLWYLVNYLVMLLVIYVVNDWWRIFMNCFMMWILLSMKCMKVYVFVFWVTTIFKAWL